MMNDQKEVNEIMAGMDRLLLAEHKLQKETAPRCHFKPMFLNMGDCGDYHTESWWECSVCGHTKLAQ